MVKGLNSFLVVLPTDMVGGAERVAMNLVGYLNQQYPNAIIYVYFMSKGDSGGWNSLKNLSNVKLLYNNFRSEKTSFPHLVYFLVKKLRKVDVIYSTHTHVNALMNLLRKLKLINCKYLVIRESTIISQRFTGYKRLIFDLLYNCYGSQDLLICQTNLMKDSLIAARHKNVISNIVTIPNPVSIQRVGLMLDKSELVSNSEQCFEIIMVGRLVAIKNHELVISALARIKKQQPYNFKLRVLGDGPTKNELKTLVEANGLNENVEFLGNMDNPFQYMNKANLGVVASISEGFPNVLLEMMAAGTNNIITTPCTGDLDQLPNISITNDHSVHSMTNAISSALITKQDYSMKYRNYVQERDVSNYWAIIDKYLKA